MSIFHDLFSYLPTQYSMRNPSATCNFVGLYWLVVSNIFHVHPYLGKISNFTYIFQMGRNHQLVVDTQISREVFPNPRFLQRQFDKQEELLGIEPTLDGSFRNSRREKPS